MDWEAIKEIAVVACIPLGIYLYHRYLKMTAPDSPGGEVVTWDEIVETFNDDEFWEHVSSVISRIKEE